MNVVDEAPDLDDALESARDLQPDIIIMNGDLPPINSAHATTLLRQNAFTGGILVISMHPEAELIHRTLGSGANGFMHKDEIDEYLVDAIRHVHRGEQYLSPKAKSAYGIMPE
jgi:DNA-binding NarL/FixJ family response regulator